MKLFSAILSFLTNRLTEQYLRDYFNMVNFIDGMRTCKFRYKIPVLMILLISISVFATVPSAITSAVCGIFILLGMFSLAIVEV